MADWEKYRAAFLNGDLKAQNLERLQTMESWLYLPFDQVPVSAAKVFDGQSEEALRPWYQLSRVLYLKLMREAGFTGPDAAQQEQSLYAACQGGQATPEQWHHGVGLFNIAQISGMMLNLHPQIGQLSAGTLAGNALQEKIGPIQAR